MAVNILITGSSGFIGSHLVKRLKTHHTIIPFDAHDGNSILQPQLDDVVKSSDVVYHLAARTDVAKSHHHARAFFQTNVYGTYQVLKAAKHWHKKIIFPSSAAVYDPLSSPYAMSKYLCETLITAYKSYIPIVTLRLFNVYGPGMHGSTMLARFKKENPITIYGDGTNTRDFIAVSDVVSIMEAALDPSWNGAVVDVGIGKPIAVRDIAARFNKPITYAPARLEVTQSQANGTLQKYYQTPLTNVFSYIDTRTQV